MSKVMLPLKGQGQGRNMLFSAASRAPGLDTVLLVDDTDGAS